MDVRECVRFVRTVIHRIVPGRSMFVCSSSSLRKISGRLSTSVTSLILRFLSKLSISHFLETT